MVVEGERGRGGPAAPPLRQDASARHVEANRGDGDAEAVRDGLEGGALDHAVRGLAQLVLRAPDARLARAHRHAQHVHRRRAQPGRQRPHTLVVVVVRHGEGRRRDEVLHGLLVLHLLLHLHLVLHLLERGHLLHALLQVLLLVAASLVHACR